MRNPHGHIIWTGGDGRDLEMDTVTCCHCNRVVLLKQDMSNAGFCLKCYDHVCGPCADAGTCRPFEKQLVELEKGITEKLMRERSIHSILRR